MRLIISIFLMFCVSISQIVYAKVTTIDEVVVEGEAIAEDKANISVKSETLPASVNVITKEDLEKMPIRHYLDMFRKTPGMITSHYGQGDIADGFGMRGYQSGHGSQVAIFVDGVPINIPHHSHSHGFADIGWLVPEMIERIEVIKGPFSALYGNFALGGVINIITKKSDKTPIIGAELGSYDAYRGITTISRSDWKPTPFLLYEAYTKNGYRDNSDYTRYNLFNKFTVPLLNGKLSIRVHYVNRDWGAPGYLSVDDVKNGTRKRTDAINPTDGGNSEYYNLVLNYTPSSGEAGPHATLYAASEDLNRYATFPPSSQRLEHNERVFYGWNLLYNYMPNKNLSLIFGTDGRYDNGDRQRYNTTNRVQTSTTQNWHIEETNIGLFFQGQYRPVDFLKVVGGLRYDIFRFDIENKIRPGNSGSGDTSIFSPKIGFVIAPIKNLNIFANKGLGFRSPAADEMSPPDKDYKNFNLKPAKVDTWDIGFNTLLFDKLHLLFDYYQTDMEREIRNVGADTINIGKSKRDGYEIEAKIYATNDLVIYSNYGWVKAKIKNPDTTGEDKITGVPKKYIGTGVEWQHSFGKDKRLLIDLGYQYLGKAPLNAAGTIYRPPVDRYMTKATYNIKEWSLFAESTYHPKKYASEGMFLIGGVPVYDPKPVWDVTAGIKYKF
ncbi:TonB-dependent receptor [hot springs metagenome]|uniref:TonB-dependent receptor n=1 Tax=hot springs metagenome TaxID=433727 RepID=A0A5J4KRX7_9ZZZZ